MRPLRRAAPVAALALILPLVVGCEQEPEDRDVVAVLLADGSGDRWRNQDLPTFADTLEADCPGCVPITRDAGGDVATQRRQFTEVIEAGADVVVLHPVSAEVGEELVLAANVPVIAYDRLVPGADHFVGVNQARSARLVAGALRELLPAGRPPLLVVSDGPGGLTDRVLRRLGNRVRVRATATTEQAETPGAWAAQQVQAGPAAAVLTGDDAVAAQVIAGFNTAGVAGPDRPLVTGYDGGLEAVRRLVRGTQAVTVHVSRIEEATAAAELAAALAQGASAPDASVEAAELEGVPATLVQPTVVTLPTLTDTLVRRGVYQIADICRGNVGPKCEQLGLR